MSKTYSPSDFKRESVPGYKSKLWRNLITGELINRREYQKQIGKPLPNRRKADKRFENGPVWFFEFRTKKGNFTEHLFEQRKAQIDRLINSFDDNWYVQVFVQGRKYGGADTGDNPSEWPWASFLMMRSVFAKKMMQHQGSIVQLAIDEWDIQQNPPYDHGINSVHVAAWHGLEKRHETDKEKEERMRTRRRNRKN